MALTDLNRNLISFKRLSGKAHTQQTFAVSEEGITSNVQLSYSTIFADDINPNPVSIGGLNVIYSTDFIVEKVRFEIEIIPDTAIGTNQSQGYRLKLPSDYTIDGLLGFKFTGGTFLHTALGKLQIVPPLYGELKPDGSTEYDPILYQTNGTTVIGKFDPIDWNLDFYNGILFVEKPPAGYDVSANRPGFIEAYLFVGNYLDEKQFGGGDGGSCLLPIVDEFLYVDTNTFSLSSNYERLIGVYLNGIRLSTQDFNISGNNVTLLDILDDGDEISIVYTNCDTIESTGTTQQFKNVLITTNPSYTLLETNQYVGSSGTTTYNLFATPEIGQEFTISDIIGIAGVTPITINGNGNSILGDTSALINTNYGSVTFLYNGNNWVVTAFS
jgi:hypothetical protein